LTRKSLASAADVSLRHLANLEYGLGNASILVLQQVAQALQCSLAELIGDVTTSSPEWLLIRELLEHRDDQTLRRVRVAIGEMLGTGGDNAARSSRIALVGLRGAGKSTLGEKLSESLKLPFVELDREVEKEAGAELGEVFAMYGQDGYRRFERRALERVLAQNEQAVIATGGSLVNDPGTYKMLLERCTCIWLKASPEEHLARVIAQGDMRPFKGRSAALEEIKRLLEDRNRLYSRADATVDTSGKTLKQSLTELRNALT
jgi:XRE family transcriptional regulator, aerobic/anaerobic benzoate catabolism transcriptional regulator